MKPLRIIFMGTPEFAVATLRALLLNGLDVVAVVTVPDKPAGRGQKVTSSAVKLFAGEKGLPVLQPVKLRDPEFIETLKGFNADLFIVVAFRMLPEQVWKLPPLGTINLHASLLPDYRGAAPINHVIINGEKKTGVTTFLINEKIDTGNILLREEVTIDPDETAGSLHDRLMITGSELVIRTIRGIADKTVVPKPQTGFLPEGILPKEAPKIFPENCIIDWSQDVVRVKNLIRGLSPYPCARTIIGNSGNRLILRIYDCRIISQTHNLDPGTIETNGRDYLRIAAESGYIEITDLQLEGRKRLFTSEFLRGFRIQDHTVIST